MRSILSRLAALCALSLLMLPACTVDSDADGPADTGADAIDAGAADAGGDDEDTAAADGASGDRDAGADATALALPGMSADAAVWVDEHGILHASCATDADCATVLGYFHARDRFAQMDLRRRITTGRIGTLVTSAVPGTPGSTGAALPGAEPLM